MKVAVVTPYFNESDDIIQRCYDSVQNCHAHIFVGDGKYNPLIDTFKNVQHEVLETNHHDAGATPRMIGAEKAFESGCDAVAFLDSDNTFCPHHIEYMIHYSQSYQVDIVTATRNICLYLDNNNISYIDGESNGNDFCDTNCMFLARETMQYLKYWQTDSKYHLVSDRIFWNSIRHLKKVHCPIPTVNYYSKWAEHYRHQANSGNSIPFDSVYLRQTENEQCFLITHRDKLKELNK